jgi:hypothetical protein
MVSRWSIINWYVGWSMIMAAFLTGAAIGLFFYREGFLGGYSSFRRRILRLGHIALAALGMMNVLFSITPAAATPSEHAWIAPWCLAVGGMSMPMVCFLSAWRAGFRHLFFVPVIALVIAAAQTLRIGPP